MQEVTVQSTGVSQEDAPRERIGIGAICGFYANVLSRILSKR